jgi:ketosteroid isomerase-like protein
MATIAAQGASRDTDVSAEFVLRSALTALAAGDFETFCEMFDPNFRFFLHGHTSISGEVTGLPAFKAWAANVMQRLTSFTQENLQLLNCGEWIVTRDRGKSATIDGRDYNNEYARFWRFKDNKCVEFVEYLDTHLVKQIFG